MPLAETIIYDSEENAIKAIQAKADVNEHDRFGFRPLIQAVICRKPKVIQALLQAGADIEQGDFYDRTALQWAADRGEVELCDFLLTSGANPNHYSADGQPILVNPILREQLDLVELFIKHKANYQFAQDFISAKLLGHRFELTGEADIVSTDGKFIPLSFEGFILEFSTGLIRRSLHNFLHSIPGQKYKEYAPKLERVLQALKFGAQLTEYGRHKDKSPFEPAIDAMLESDILLLPVAFQGHAITFIKYGNLWAKCDRGVGAIANTIVVSAIGNPYTANKDLFKKLLYQHKTTEFINHDLHELLSLKTLMTLPTRHQLSGNCSWANVETSVPTMLFMLSYNPQIHTNLRELTALQKEIYQFYNAWVEWDQDSSLEEAIEDFAAADHLRKLSKAIILGGILVQRCDARYATHVARAKKILSILSQPDFSFILENYCRIFFKPGAGKAGQRVKKLFKTCGLDCEKITMKKTVNYLQTNVHTDNLVRMTTALHVAALQGKLDAVKHLVDELHIDIDYLDRTGSTALMYAAYAGHKDIVEFLVKRGANLAIKNLKGGTASRYAAYAGHKIIVEFLNNISS
jgi:ankyrin repeat protein